MRNELVKAAGVVFGFWLSLLVVRDWLTGWFSLSVFLENLAITPVFLGLGLLGGVGLIVVKKRALKAVAYGDARRGLSVSLGQVPTGKSVAASSKGAISLPVRVAQWLSDMESDAGLAAYALLFRQIAGALAARPGFPATIVPGGHGGVDLYTHTMLVVDAILEHAPAFSYVGLRYPAGQVAVAPSDPHYRFDPRDPLIPLVAIAHDLGKLECYVRQDGRWVEVVKAHDIRGGQILARLDRFWDLPTPDRRALMLAVSYYHQELNIPLNGGDRPRALIGLLLAADALAGKKETEVAKARLAFVESAPALNAEAPAEGAPKTSAAVPAVDGSSSLAGSDDRILAEFEALIREPGRINGPDQDVRIGFKHGDLVVLSEQKVRALLAARIESKRLAVAKKPDGQFFLTTSLNELLQKKGALVSEFAGKPLSPARSVFRIKMTDPQSGKTVTNWPAAILLHASSYHEIGSMADSLYPVTTIVPRWGAPGLRVADDASGKTTDAKKIIDIDENCRDGNSDYAASPASSYDEKERLSEVQPLPVDKPELSSQKTPDGSRLDVIRRAVMSLADKGKVLDKLLYVDIGNVAEFSGLQIEDILSLLSDAKDCGIVIKRGKSGGVWVGVGFSERE